MKQLMLIGFAILTFVSCQNNSKRYTQSSPEIDIVKAALNDYDYQNWDTLVTRYADTAKIYHNTRANVLTPQDLPEYYQNNDVSFSTRAFEDENREYEMIVDNQGQTWVNFWGLWKGNLTNNNREIVIPVHTTTQFIDGKIVMEYGYWDRSELILAIQEMVAEKIVEEQGIEE